MNYKGVKVRVLGENNGYIVLFVLIFSFLLLFFVKGNTYELQKNSSGVYGKFLDYTVPTIKAVSVKNSKPEGEDVSIKEKILDFFGLDVGNPLSLISREVASFPKGNSSEIGKVETDKNKTVIDFLNPFSLKEDWVLKNPGGASSGDSSTQVDNLNLPNLVAPVYDPSLVKPLNLSKPEVFIYHTHTGEGYSPFQGRADSRDENKNVCSVGNIMANDLQTNYGISVIHDKTEHDVIYSNAYARSGETLGKYLKKYNDFKIIIDLHRDSGLNRNTTVTKINGENVAKIMFVLTKKNPHFSKNMELSTSLMNISNKLYPNLCRGINLEYDYGTKYFNQDKSNNAILIEVGQDSNTIEEANATAKYLSRIIAQYLNGKN